MMQCAGGKLIQYIEEFNKKENRLPENFEMTKYESEDSAGPFYEKISDSTYTISFCLGFYYYIFDSQKNEWIYFP